MTGNKHLDTVELKQEVVQYIDAHLEEYIKIADTIFANPEIGFEEVNSSRLLGNKLTEHGFAVTFGIAELPTAFLARYSGQEDGPRVALMAEYDALAEIGHACGHNLIGTQSVAAAIAVKSILSELAGEILVIGSPAEEGGGGKAILVENGVFDDVDVALMMHPSRHNMTRRTTLANVGFKFEYFGKSSHAGSAPEKGINALNAVIHLFNGINALRQHVEPSVRIHGIITNGGDATNMVPAYSSASIAVRANNKHNLDHVVKQVLDCAKAGARATGAELRYERPSFAIEAMMPNPILADLVDANMETLGLEVLEPWAGMKMGSTDMGNVSQVVPSLHPFIYLTDFPSHSAEFKELAGSKAGHEIMRKASKILAMTLIDLLTSPEYVDQAKLAFEDQKAGQL